MTKLSFGCGRQSNQRPYTASDQYQQHTCQGSMCEHHNLKLTTWNCRGLTTGEPYIHQLAEDGSDIIVVTEHWLWPYESKRLSEFHPAFSAECSTDARLHVNSDLERGCGGVGIMFRKSLSISPLSSISSDCICGVRVHQTSLEPSCITVLGCISLVLIRALMHTVVPYLNLSTSYH